MSIPAVLAVEGTGSAQCRSLAIIRWLSIPPITRTELLSLLEAAFRAEPHVHAYWLEGSEANGTVDEYSDVDACVDVSDGHEQHVIESITAELEERGVLAGFVQREHAHPKLRHRVFDFVGHRFFHLDLVVQSHSRAPRESEFVRGDTIECPRVVFDRSGVIRMVEPDLESERARIRERVRRLPPQLGTRGAEAYARRGAYIEAAFLFRRDVVDPLLGALRLSHTPRHPDYGVVHASRHLPATDVRMLEALYGCSTNADILAGIERAVAAYTDARNELRGRWLDSDEER